MPNRTKTRYDSSKFHLAGQRVVELPSGEIARWQLGKYPYGTEIQPGSKGRRRIVCDKSASNSMGAVRPDRPIMTGGSFFKNVLPGKHTLHAKGAAVNRFREATSVIVANASAEPIPVVIRLEQGSKRRI
jgi:hypothetical protein